MNTRREVKAQRLLEEALDLSRERRGNPGTSQRVRAYDIAMNQLRWSAAKLHPREYSDRSQLTWTVPIQINTTVNLGQKDAKESFEDGGGVYTVEAKMTETGPSEANEQIEGAPVPKRIRKGKGKHHG